MSPHISNSTKILQSDDWFLWLVKSFIHQISRKVLEKVCAWVHVSPLYQNHIYTDLLSFLTGTVSQSCLRYCLPGCSPHFAPVQFSSVTQLCLTLCNLMDCSTPGFPVHHQLQEFTRLTSIELVMQSSHLILCRPLLLLPSIFPSIRVSSNESVLCIRWPKCCHQIKLNPQLSLCATILSQQKLQEWFNDLLFVVLLVRRRLRI